MYTRNHLKWRILIARRLDALFYEPGNASRSHKRAYNRFIKFILGVDYDTFRTYCNPRKYDISDMRLPARIEIALREFVRYATSDPEMKYSAHILPEPPIRIVHPRKSPDRTASAPVRFRRTDDPCPGPHGQ